MAKTAAKRTAAKTAGAASRRGPIRPMLLAAGLALYWFVEFQDLSGIADAPMWGYAVAFGVRLLTDFIGALVVVSALQLLLVLGRLAVGYLRGLWLQASSR